MKKIIIDPAKINQISLQHIFNQIDTGGRWTEGWQSFLGPAGVEHYRLLAYLSLHVTNETIIDLGTLSGASSLALSYNPTNQVISFDLPITVFHNGVPGTSQWQNLDPELVLDYSLAEHSIPNITYIKGNCLEYEDVLLSSSIIFLDIDHSGIEEQKIIDMLRNKNWEGLLIMDDIHWTTLNVIWNALPLEKYVVTHVGHGRDGTGLINFGKKFEIVIK